MLCTNLIDFYRSLSRRKFIQREKRREGANFGPIWYFFLFSNQSLFSSIQISHISIQISWSLPLEIGGYLDSHFPLYPLYRRFTVSVGKYWIEKGEDWSHFLDISAEIGGEWVQDERAERKRKGNSAMIYKSGRKVWIFEDVRRLTIRGILFFDW